MVLSQWQLNCNTDFFCDSMMSLYLLVEIHFSQSHLVEATHAADDVDTVDTEGMLLADDGGCEGG